MAILEALGTPPNCGHFEPKIGDFQPFFGGEIFTDPTLNIRQNIEKKKGDFAAKFAQKWRFLD